MKAAVVNTFSKPPVWGEFDTPVPQSDEVLVEVKAAAISQLARLQAAGKHYSSGQPPFVPGVDGVGCLEDGRRVYFAFPRAPVGAMAERVAVKAANLVMLPDELSDITAAAIANPGMSSWAALVAQCDFRAGESVLINGATGASGRLAISIAKHLGASRVITTGRSEVHRSDMLALGADDYILTGEISAFEPQLRAEFERGVDVVLDYLWGQPAEMILRAGAGKAASDPQRRIRFVNIGSLAGLEASVPAAVLRSSRLEVLGSGLGSTPLPDLISAIDGVMQSVTRAGLTIETQALPVAQVEEAWGLNTTARTVLTF